MSTLLAELMADSPVALYRMDEGGGTAMVDAMGGLSGTYRGGIGPTAGPPLLPITVPLFDGVGRTATCATVPDQSVLDVGDVFSISLWIKFTTTSVVQGMCDRGSQGFIFRTDTGGRPLLRCNSVQDIVTGANALPVGVWNHLGAWKNGATSAGITQQGVSVGGTVTNATCRANALPLTVAASDGGTSDFAAAAMCYLAIFRTALTPARFMAHYKAGASRFYGVM